MFPQNGVQLLRFHLNDAPAEEFTTPSDHKSW
jgi:hypothetical protein